MVATLLDAGHSSADVMDRYSQEEIEAHYHAVLRTQSKKRLQRIIDIAAAFGNLKKHVRRSHIRQLRETGERLYRLIQTRSKTQMEQLFDGLSNMKAKGTSRDLEVADANN